MILWDWFRDGGWLWLALAVFVAGITATIVVLVRRDNALIAACKSPVLVDVYRWTHLQPTMIGRTTVLIPQQRVTYTYHCADGSELRTGSFLKWATMPGGAKAE